MEEIERSAWKSHKNVVKKFLGNYKNPDFDDIAYRRPAGELESLRLLNEL